MGSPSSTNAPLEGGGRKGIQKHFPVIPTSGHLFKQHVHNLLPSIPVQDSCTPHYHEYDASATWKRHSENMRRAFLLVRISTSSQRHSTYQFWRFCSKETQRDSSRPWQQQLVTWAISPILPSVPNPIPNQSPPVVLHQCRTYTRHTQCLQVPIPRGYHVQRLMLASRLPGTSCSRRPTVPAGVWP